MRLERERSDGRRDFWEANAKKNTLEIQTGIVHIKNKRETKTFGTPKDARAALTKLEAAKRKAGFSEPVAIGSQFLPAPIPTNPALEDAIRDARDDAGPCEVYADWLQAQGSPAGEYVALAAALEKKSDARKRKRCDELARSLALPTPDFATWTSRHGFWRTLRLENSKDWMDESFDAATFARKLFATPMCAALDELRIGVLRWEYNDDDVPAILEVARDHAWAKSLSHLHLGDVSSRIDMAHHRIGDVGARITKAFPALRSLKLHSGQWGDTDTSFGVAGLALPKLETLVVETCAMTKRRLGHLLAAKLPAVTKLELWFGGLDRDCNVKLADLAPLFANKAFTKVTHLGLRNQAYGVELVERLAASKLAKQLVTLDLSMSTLDDGDTQGLAALVRRFPKLQVLDVDDNFLSPRGLATLREAFTKVLSNEQDKLEWADGDGRFVSVHE